MGFVLLTAPAEAADVEVALAIDGAEVAHVVRDAIPGRQEPVVLPTARGTWTLSWTLDPADDGRLVAELHLASPSGGSSGLAPVLAFTVGDTTEWGSFADGHAVAVRLRHVETRVRCEQLRQPTVDELSDALTAAVARAGSRVQVVVGPGTYPHGAGDVVSVCLTEPSR